MKPRRSRPSASHSSVGVPVPGYEHLPPFDPAAFLGHEPHDAADVQAAALQYAKDHQADAGVPLHHLAWAAYWTVVADDARLAIQERLGWFD